ncbi:23S rRNA (guanosine(2251)-2'-O)-methyltransferase RlmB [Aquirufa ecclesiirivi]|uniref:23S rRNA (Guanosine(2251)-2'-O)-methyltransferase RlmB n=1 Tax=Aquirufa ecclesiirivi TaxID=2715124 RepID=A0ABT4JDZ4_9BACT|nr:23S rRNA (guanosine(2251)-2'-O)-methyltransferase RlmB [Aquirufa ecclesiirivi]MCZ2472984.1 23S rRNA (guanosine(2251)-2'-O)-methyltransferase RlmB [Aquirufa ecclesiirivi]MCZ2474448.1 23S rRNA (guanosine(2251)-2'-O)-methyltransferase RlmB [Aquirufa ecclesiirivi]MDF0694556.1 23S rRNA (guanosine(2251)-2'-O)-methyltransferase RlmB [Aquirufa ecclesiirivi]
MSFEQDPKPYKKPFRHFTTPKTDNKEFVFGIQSVLETLRAGKEIDRLLVQRELGSIEILELAKEKGIQVQKVPIEKLNRITRKNHQGAIAFVSAIHYAKIDNIIADTFEKGQTPLILILDRITDVRNFGAIARTAECAGVHAIVIPSRGAAQINADAMKTSSGALNFLPVCREENLISTIEYLQNAGLKVIACTEKTKDSVYVKDFKEPTAIVLGSEEDGISDEIIRKADELAAIPQSGQVGSLNVSVAAGVIIYEALRQRLN